MRFVIELRGGKVKLNLTCRSISCMQKACCKNRIKPRETKYKGDQMKINWKEDAYKSNAMKMELKQMKTNK